MIIHQHWDSDFFGIKIGKMEIQNAKTFDVKLFKKCYKMEEFDLIYLFVNGGMLSKQQIFDANLELIDIMIYCSLELSELSSPNSTFELFSQPSEQELNEIYAISDQISSVSRFYREEKLGPTKAKELYRKWIDNTFNKSYADGILVSRTNERISGLFVVKNDYQLKVGYCSLIGVEKSFKGLGVGKQLWNDALSYWSKISLIEKAIVPFSFLNEESLAFHIKIGFRKIEKINYIYHYRK